MGSKSDWETMRHAAELLTQFDVPHDCRVVSAHRTPQWMCRLCCLGRARGLAVIIAGAAARGIAGNGRFADGAASAGCAGAKPVFPGSIRFAIVQMPGGIPVGTLAIGEAGAKNAALLAAAQLPQFTSGPRQKN